MVYECSPSLLGFAREFSVFKTPTTRTQGWDETANETRGEGDVVDTIGTLLLWRFLIEKGIASTYLLTAGEGDEADLIVRTPEGRATINVKTSRWDPPNGDCPCRNNHIAIKSCEVGKGLSDVYVQVFVHLSAEEPHVHLCNWIPSASRAFRSQAKCIIPNTNGTKGYWIERRHLSPIGLLPNYLRSRAA